jgi:hypothetical protein
MDLPVRRPAGENPWPAEHCDSTHKARRGHSTATVSAAAKVLTSRISRMFTMSDT